MQTFKYTAVDLHNRTCRGRSLAQDEQDLRIQLSRQGLYLLRAAPAPDRALSAFWSVTGRVKTDELTSFCRQLATMASAGVPLPDCLSILAGQAFTGYFRRVLSQVYADVQVGLLLSQAMARHRRAFPYLLTSMIYVGEQSGMLDRILLHCADYYENDAKLRARAKSALVYPLFLLGMTLAIAVLMVAFVVPAFRTALTAMEVELPPLTRAVIAISDWSSRYGLAALAGGLALGMLLVLGARTGRGQYLWHSLLLRLPLVRSVQLAWITARFARSFGLLLSGGMDLARAMETVSPVLGNQNVRRRFARAAAQVNEGQPLAAALGEQRLFSPVLLQMVAVGERTGSLDQLLLHSCDYFEEQSRRTLDALTSLLQPLLLGLMGGVVALLFLALYSPMLSMMQTL